MNQLRSMALRGSLALLALVVAAGCSSPSDADAPRVDGAIFLARDAPASAVMDALFEGRVVRDQAGCLRLGDADGATVIWPHGFSLDEDGGDLRVKDDQGREVGRIGGEFSLGGGEVDALHDGLEISAADRELAASECPGRYWITGDVPADA